ncbi:hypothetical protein QP415_03610 [Pauljensenia sp. UMB3104]|uniref:hypothetical protein n=1 Tax=Pauljensenia sp. UMB3104 TaxID=3046331 RepID=UPI00254A5F3A|nr:hypothetical protein [Pauljensenia sp. UMB3104]MDK7158947.1 hypothetical protein [Pauljensenia sp. UMB3104]
MSTVSYITDTNADRFARYLIVDGERETAEEWFEKSLPGDEIEDLREALIEAAVRMSGEDRELLASNGFKIAEIPLAYTEADDARVFGEYNVFDGGLDGIYNAIAAECEAWGLTDGYVSVWETLTVLEEIGGDVERFLD